MDTRGLILDAQFLYVNGKYGSLSDIAIVCFYYTEFTGTQVKLIVRGR